MTIRKKLAYLSLGMLILLIAGYLGSGYMVYDRLSRVNRNVKNAGNEPSKFQVNEPPFQGFDTRPYLMQNYEKVRLSSREKNIMLSGWYIPGDPAAPAIVLTHGFGSSMNEGSIIVAAGMLHRGGFNVLLYDLRNHGSSDGDGGRTAIGNTEYLDVLGAWDWLVTLKKFPTEKVGLYGVSLGGGASLIAFGREPRIRAAFVDSPFFDLRRAVKEELVRNGYPSLLAYAGLFMARIAGGVDLLAHSPIDAIRHNNRRPIFAVHGADDKRLSVSHSRDIERLAGLTGANVTTWFPEGIGHHPSACLTLSDEYEKRLVAFFRDALPR